MGKRKAKARNNPRYEAFAREFMVDLNATKAAIRAGYSAKTAHTQGPRLLQIVEVQTLIEGLQAQNRAANTDLRSRIERELEIIAFADIGEVLTSDNDGKVVVRPIEGLKPEVRRTIESITQVTTEKSVNRRRVQYGAEGSGDDGGDYKETTIESIRLGVKQHSKLTAIQMLIDLHGLAAPKKVDATLNNAPAKQRLAARLEQLAKRLPG